LLQHRIINKVKNPGLRKAISGMQAEADIASSIGMLAKCRNRSTAK
jgi:hypothetical protein